MDTYFLNRMKRDLGSVALDDNSPNDIRINLRPDEDSAPTTEVALKRTGNGYQLTSIISGLSRKEELTPQEVFRLKQVLAVSEIDPDYQEGILAAATAQSNPDAENPVPNMPIQATTALIVIDLDKQYLSDDNHQDEVEKINALIKKATDNGVPVIIVSYADSGGTDPVAVRGVGYQNNAGENLDGDGIFRIEKGRDDLFEDPGAKATLDQIMKLNGSPGNIIVAGLNQDACVMVTVRSLLNSNDNLRVFTSEGIVFNQAGPSDEAPGSFYTGNRRISVMQDYEIEKMITDHS